MSYRTDLDTVSNLSQQVSRLQRRTTLPPSIELQAAEVITGVSGATVTIPWAQIIRQNTDSLTWPSVDDPANPRTPNYVTINAPGLYLIDIKLISNAAVAFTCNLNVTYNFVSTAQTIVFSCGAILNNILTTALYLYEGAKVFITINSAPTQMTFNTSALGASPYLTIVGLSQQWDTPVGKATHIIRSTALNVATSTNTNIPWNNVPANYLESSIRYLHGVNDLRAFNSAGSAGVAMRVPYNGTYLVTATVTWDAGQAGTQRYCSLIYNSTVIAAGYTDPSLPVVHPITMSAVYDMVAGDTLYIQCIQNAGAIRTILADKVVDFAVTAFNLVMLST